MSPEQALYYSVLIIVLRITVLIPRYGFSIDLIFPFCPQSRPLRSLEKSIMIIKLEASRREGPQLILKMGMCDKRYLA